MSWVAIDEDETTHTSARAVNPLHSWAQTVTRNVESPLVAIPPLKSLPPMIRAEAMASSAVTKRDYAPGHTLGSQLKPGSSGSRAERATTASSTRKNLIWVIPAEEDMHRPTTLFAATMALVLIASACGSDTPTVADTLDGTTITLVTHDSFYLSDGTLQSFTDQTGVKVELLSSGDAGAMVSQSVISAGNPVGDVMFGIDNTFLQRGLDAALFEPYSSPALADVPDEFELDPQHRVTPIDFGDVCVNYWTDALTAAAPVTLDDLVKPDYADQLVVENPETS